MKYNFYQIIINPTGSAVITAVIMALTKKQALKKIGAIENPEIVYKISKLNEEPLFIGS